ncbi:caldesmon-like isoform X6 [Zophobas morio]|uniref:caldesmon-like isoform X6 n=1 Tax=Zophobas morio TaxID=2755281 RepID=UPI0030830C0C
MESAETFIALNIVTMASELTSDLNAIDSDNSGKLFSAKELNTTAKPRKTKAEYQKEYRERQKAKKNENKQESTAKPRKTKADYQKEYRERQKAKKNENKQESTAKPRKTKAEYQKEYRARQKAKKNENKQESTAKPRKTNAERQKAFRERQKMMKIKNKRERTAYKRTMEKKPDKPEDVTNKPLPSMSEPMEAQDAVAFTLATPFAQPIIAASKSKAQKQREYRQRIKASRTPAQAAAARKSNNERQRNNRLRQAANLAIASNSLETTTTSPSCSGEESNNVQTRSQRQHAQQQSTTTADQPDERVNLTNEPLFPAIPVPMEVQEAVASTSATPFAEPITAAPKTRAQKKRLEWKPYDDDRIPPHKTHRSSQLRSNKNC